MRKNVSIPLKINLPVRLRSCRNRGGILDTSRKFLRKILGFAGLLIGCHSIPLQSERDHDLVALFDTLGFECGCLLFPATSIMAPVVLKNDLSRMSGI
jgi:hypothetical protein